MTTSHIYYEDRFSTNGITVGRVLNVSPYRGQDHEQQYLVQFERGTLRLGDEQSEVLAAELLAARKCPGSARRPNVKYPPPECSGALADVGGDIEGDPRAQCVWCGNANTPGHECGRGQR